MLIPPNIASSAALIQQIAPQIVRARELDVYGDGYERRLLITYLG